MPLQAGTRLGGYEILAQIGVGGMGEVYRATDTRLKRDVALKVLPDTFAQDPDRLARFQREAELLATLNHPNIAGIHGLEESNGVRALVLELVEGPTLADRIAKGPIPLDEALPIARQIAEALEAAHEKGVIHRDLKPANIKITPDGSVKVLDFGLAKLAEAPTASGAGVGLSQSPTITTPAMMTGIGVILGTAAYMSPEQAKGRAADKRSDVWAFGCVLYEMLTGKRAFEGEDVSETLASVLKSTPDWTAWPTATPAAIQVLIEGCLAKDRRARVGDISAVRFVLAEAARLSPRGIAVPAADDRTRGSRRTGMMTLAVAVFAAAALGAVVAWNLRPAAARPPVTRTLLKLSDDEGQLSQLGRQMIAISPDGTRIAHTANQRLWLRSVSDFDSRAIASGTIGIHSPAFSPDGQSVAFYSGNAMKRVSVIGDAPVTLCAVDAPFGVAWDASGIIVGQGAKGIVRCAPSGGPAEQLATVQRDEQAHGPQMLPDGQHLLFAIAKTDSSADGGVAARWDRAQIVIQDLKSGQRNTVINGGSNGRYVASGHLLYAIGGVVLAVPFDLRTLATSGVAAPVLEGVSRAARTNATGAAHMAVSSGGTLLYVPGPVSPSSNLRQLTLADRAGVVTPLKLPAGPYAHVRASRDGKRLALGSDDGMEAIVWIYDLAETSAVRRLTLDGKNRFPIWSPDGERVAFQSDREGDLAIFTQRVDGTGSIERLTKPDKREAHVPGSWAPDGKSLAFTVSKERSLALWTVSLADKKMAPYGHVVSAEAIEPTFSPDGRWIAYSAAPPSTGVSPNRGVYVQPVPASGAVYQAPKQQLDFQPVWSPDGRELFYVPSAASGRIAAARVSTQSGVTFGAPQILPARVTAARTSNEPRAFDILPDGRFIGLIGSGSDTLAAIELRLVLNWFEELKQRVPAK